MSKRKKKKKDRAAATLYIESVAQTWACGSLPKTLRPKSKEMKSTD